MSAIRSKSVPALLALLAALPLALAAAPARAAERTVDRSFASPPPSFELGNLAGRVELVRSGGAALRVVATIHAQATDSSATAALLDDFELDFDEGSGRLRVEARYPVDRHRTFHYPGSPAGPEGVLGWLFDGSSQVEYLGRKVRVTSQRSASAPTLYADVRVEVPSGLRVKVRNAVGLVTSSGIEGPQTLDTSSGDIHVADGAGELSLDTGSGEIRVVDQEGDVRADTGSGDIHLERVRAREVVADTGSGDITLESVSGSLDANTGSGDVVGRELAFGERLRADTGSGDVRLAGDFGAVRDLSIDTGSGDVVLSVTGGAPSVTLAIDTGSGDVDLDLPEARVRKWKGEIVAEIGAAEGRGRIDTGSGDVRVGRGR